MKLRGSLLCSPELATDPYAEFMCTTPYPPCKDCDYLKLGDDHFQIISI